MNKLAINQFSLTVTPQQNWWTQKSKLLSTKHIVGRLNLWRTIKRRCGLYLPDNTFFLLSLTSRTVSPLGHAGCWTLTRQGDHYKQWCCRINREETIQTIRSTLHLYYHCRSSLFSLPLILRLFISFRYNFNALFARVRSTNSTPHLGGVLRQTILRLTQGMLIQVSN